MKPGPMNIIAPRVKEPTAIQKPFYKLYKKVVEDFYLNRILYLKKNWILRNLLTCDF